MNQVGRVSLKLSQHEAANDRAPDRPMQVGELANLQLALTFSVHLAGVGANDHRAQAALRQILCQSQCVCATSSNGEPPREQQDERFDFGHGACLVKDEAALVPYRRGMGLLPV